VVYAELRQAILRGALRAGERLREEDLAERMRVSRTPVREAIGRLEAEGLAVALPRRGLAVAEVSPEHVMEIYLVREVLEGAASRLAARHVTRLEATHLEELLEGMGEAVARDDTAAMESLNRRFHSLIYAAAKNRLIQQILDDLWDDLGRFGVTTFAYPGRKKEALAEHRAIADAIVGGREAEAERLARAHLAAGREVRLRLLHRREASPHGGAVLAGPRGEGDGEGVTTGRGRATPRSRSGGAGNGNRAVRPATAARGTTAQRRR
jgi:DNA-binding GntR family transcriptional regulator